MPPQTTLVCSICLTPFNVANWELRRERKFCSKSCAMRSRAGAKHPRYKGGTINEYGYRMISVGGVKRLEHRVIMERHLGRSLERHEVIHHRDGDPQNNELSNLKLLDSQSEHVREHARSRTFWARRYDACVRCGTSERPHESRGLCKLCYSRWRAGQSWQGQWSYCQQCGKADSREEAGGLCARCYFQQRSTTYEWSWYHPRCVACGTTERRHEAKGECQRCYWRRTTRERRAK